MPTTFRTPVHFFHPMFLITLLFDEASYWYVGMRYKQNVKCTEDKKKNHNSGTNKSFTLDM
jgi:hypothetical protein